MSPHGHTDAHSPASARNAAQPDRYGTRGRKGTSGDLTGKAMALVMVAILIAGVFFTYQYFSTKKSVNASISFVAHEVLNDHTLRLWADVTRNDPDSPAYCIVQAYDYSKAEVGRREIPIPANGEKAMRVTVDIPTNARAVAGGVYGCSSAMPEYLDPTHSDYTFEDVPS